MSGRGKRAWTEPKKPVPPGLVSQSLQGVAPYPPAAAAANAGPGSSTALAVTGQQGVWVYVWADVGV